MRLTKIKLAGFKSFVDPTTVSFPSNLVGVVGPNGCGKSNVIDAVRWVMGESSAKMLRGESMADVIFNGSSGRKPVGTATIELVFDNSDGTVTGALAQFNEISVKRLVSRDGQSAYFMNGARCRRRDIQDLFLGTGLGPRSYAIIEQGMISRFIEARPDELRLFIEEAAGISKYKERRRETETRIRNTRENLERLDDLREEIAKQLQHLERQAATAARYRTLKEEQRRLEDELAALQWQSLDETLTQQDRTLGGGETALAAEQAELRRLEAEIERGRAGYTEASDAFNAVQGRYYAIGAEIARLEQAIRFATENRNRQEAELGRLRRELDEAGGVAGRDQARLAELDADLARDTPLLTAAAAALAAVRARLIEAEARLERCQQDWDDAQAAAAAPAQEAQRERAQINLLEQRLGQDASRVARIEDELGRLGSADLEERINHLEERSDGLDERLHLAADAQTRASEALRRADEERRALAARLDAARTELQTTRGRQASLEALQDAALEGADPAVAAWFEANGLQDTPRLLDLISVTPGYERACEVALGDLLGAPCVTAFDNLLTGLPTGALSLVDANASTDAPAVPAALADQVSGPAALRALLAGVSVADTLAEARAQQTAGAPTQRSVTRDGLLLGPGWLRTPDTGPQLAGSIQRAEDLKALQAAAEELDQVISEFTEDQETAALERNRLEQARDDAQEALARLSRERAALDAELGAGRARLEHLRERRAALTDERDDLTARHADALADIEDARERLHAALEESETASLAREALLAERERLRAGVATARTEEGQLRDTVSALTVGIETRRAQHEAILAALGRAGERLADLHRRRDELAEALAEGAEPMEESRERLEEQLERQVAVEQELGATRGRMEAIDTAVRDAEQARQRREQALTEAARGLDALRLERQEVLVRRRTLEEQLSARGSEPRAVLAALSEPPGELEAALTSWRTELDAVAARIARLGNINLAAIDEFEEQAERKRHLDAQHADLTEALETLEAAIRKIDRETRARFKETFDRVDGGLRELFPRVFGGGQAYLELTGEDLLETGVTIMARPPGKRNSSIHLLSGGEKALTAVALVFAIFQLNPAPFCMLDEVDAPLDDANVGRFCALVRSMSEQVQFIFISHNKVTMEIADQLIGVTMHEPGVSRLVTVDVEEAARMAVG